MLGKTGEGCDGLLMSIPIRASDLASLPVGDRAEFFAQLTKEQQEALQYEWRFWARPEQLEPESLGPNGTKSIWACMCGRGWGKSRTLVEWIRYRVRNGAKNIIIAGGTAGDIRDTLIYGESGFMSNCRESDRPIYYPSKSHLIFNTGSKALLISAEEPDRFRGKQCDTFACDELASWQGVRDIEDITSPLLSYNQIKFGWRLGRTYGVLPRGIITTTPEPSPLIISLLSDPQVYLTRGSSFDNAANLTDQFVSDMRKIENTRTGRQEVHGDVLFESKDALWRSAEIEKYRYRGERGPISPNRLEFLRRIVVAIDPAVSKTKLSDETGIVVAGLGVDGHGYVLADLSGKYTPPEWARIAINAYRLWRADRIIAEKNNGGDLVELNLRTFDRYISYKAVVASRGKRTRAEPIASLSEQGLVHMVGHHTTLEEKLVRWAPNLGQPSPDRLDAMVWALSELMLNKGNGPRRDLSNLESA